MDDLSTRKPHTTTSQSAQKKAKKGSDSFTNETEANLQRLCASFLHEKRLLISSHRGPFTYQKDEKGQMSEHRGSGGVATALLSLARYTRLTWIAAGISETDRELAQQGSFDPETVTESESSTNAQLKLRFVPIDQHIFEKYINIMSNPILWFLQHKMTDLLEDKIDRKTLWDSWRNGYIPANKAFATAILDEATREESAPCVIFHDYQLYLAPQLVRLERKDLAMLHFTHIPWPEPEGWASLPEAFVRGICEGLLSCDVAGFQTHQDACHFAQTCLRYLPGCVLRDQGSAGLILDYQGTVTRAVTYPISIDPLTIREEMGSSATRKWKKQLAADCRNAERILVRVDRLDPAKNTLGGFQAYNQFLERRSDWHGRLVFLALLVPTRESVSEYATYEKEVFEAIEAINTRFGRPGWKPILAFRGNDFNRALAALSLADVTLVNSLADGMNLVAKEAVIANKKSGVLVLSKMAGAWEELQDGCLSLDPENLQETEERLEEALEMPLAERRQRAAIMRDIVEENTLVRWLARQMHDLYDAQGVRQINEIFHPAKHARQVIASSIPQGSRKRKR